MSRLKDLAIIATACATLAAGAAWWYDKQERHEAQCAPIRADAKAAGKIDTSPVEPLILATSQTYNGPRMNTWAELGPTWPPALHATL